jgi:excinuclease ABC subunit C
LIRKRDLIKIANPGTVLGPFSSAYKLKQVLRIARKIFPWCDLAEKSRGKTQQPCFYYHLDLCPGACIAQISAKDYQHNIKQLLLFLQGKKKEVITQLKEQMTTASNKLEFEQAAQLKQKIQLIEDVTHKRFKLKPDLILPALHDNMSQHALDHLRRILIETGAISSAQQLTRIEGYDVSNLQGEDAAVSMIVFLQGEPNKSEYRLFNIKQLTTPNDYQMLKEAFSRRSKHDEWDKPDLIVVDGGKGQIKAALFAWPETPTVIGIAKKPDRLIIPLYQTDQVNNTAEKVSGIKTRYKIITLPQDHPALHLIQQIRDESHRFARKQHIRLRRAKMID